jgi:hypothetical protein
MPFLDTLRLFPTIPQSWWYTEMLESGQRSKMCLVVRVWLILVGSNWNIKLGSLSNIALVLWWRGTMISTFWALYPDFLSCCWASSCNHFDPWILRVWLRCSVCLLSALLYLYCTETSLCEKRFQDILSRMMSVLSCITQFMTSSSYRELTTFFAKKFTLAQSWTDECCVILVKGDVKSGYNIPGINDLTELNERLAVEIPPSVRVYPSGRRATVIPIVAMCVDNNGLKTNLRRRLKEIV